MSSKETKKQKNNKSKKSTKGSTIIIDESRGLVFDSEKEVVDHFQNQISALEKEYNEVRREGDTSFDDSQSYEESLSELLQDPDEVWLSLDVFQDIPLATFIGHFESEDGQNNFYYLALTYFVENLPRFVFMHFATQDLNVVRKFQRGEKIYDRLNRQVSSDEEPVDALTEGDELAVGLYRAMLKLRGPADVPEDEFDSFIKYREETIQEPDEIWRKTDSEGRVLVSFIKNLEDQDTKYVVMTMEDEASESQYLLFSFPTKDSNLIDRYRQGESLDTMSYVREESH